MISRPLYSGMVNGHRLRFFGNPNCRPELAWHASNDLFVALRYPIAVHPPLLRALQAGWGQQLANIATSGGPMVIAPHPIAVELFNAAIECGLIGVDVRLQYERAAATALLEQTVGLPLDLAYQLSDAAYRNTWAQP